MLPRTRRTFIIGWTVAAIIVLCTQIVALMTPAPTPGSHNVVLIGPTPVVLAAIGANLLILCLLITMGGKPDATFQGATNPLGRSVRAATTGLLASFLMVFAATIAVNLLIAQVAHFSN